MPDLSLSGRSRASRSPENRHRLQPKDLPGEPLKATLKKVMHENDRVHQLEQEKAALEEITKELLFREAVRKGRLCRR